MSIGICNMFLFTYCVSATMMPNLGINSLLMSFLLILQNGITWSILNSTSMPYYCNALTPSDFMVGVCLGTAVGGSILAFVLSLFYGQMSKCVRVQLSTFSYDCEHKGTMSGIWFWATFVFLLDMMVAVLIALGRDELTLFAQSLYEDIGISMDEYSADSYQVTPNFMASHSAIGEAQFSTPSQEVGYNNSHNSMSVKNSERVPLAKITSV